MRRRALIAVRFLFAFLLAAGAGCNWSSTRRGGSQSPPTPDQIARAQEISERAQAAVDKGDLEQARQELVQLVSVNPRSAEAHQRLGKVLQLQARPGEAEACFRRALELDPDYVGALIGLGQIEADRGDPGVGLKRIETAIEIEPHEPEAHFAQGCIHESQGRTDDALASYFRTLESDPIHLQASRRIAAIQLARNQPDQALARLDQSVELAPSNGEVRLLRGRAHFALHHLPQAIADFRAAAGLLADRPDIFYQLALALEAAHQPTDALRAAEQALRLAPDYADAHDLSQKLRR